MCWGTTVGCDTLLLSVTLCDGQVSREASYMVGDSTMELYMVDAGSHDHSIIGNYHRMN